MLRRYLPLATCVLFLLTATFTSGQEKKEIKPIRALLITGGCCHDYAKQKLILPEAVSKRANVEWTVVHQGGTTTDTRIPYYEKEDWAKGFDVVVHNECFAGVADPAWTAKVLKPHREGTPAVVIHCAMHCYRDKTDEWFKFVGVTSRGHGANYPFEVVNLEPDNEIMKGFGDKWMTPKGELYFIEKLWPSAKPLAHAMSRDSKKNEVCVWTNMYTDRTRVFGTTIGHHNEEMNDEVFQNYITRGLLWTCDKLNDDYLTPAKEIKIEHIVDPKDNKPKGPMGEPTPATKTGKKVLAPKNLALGKTTSASTWQEENGHATQNAVDGDYSTRWCANNDQTGNWWQVDLGQPEEIKGTRVTWEFDNRHYQYTVEGSADGKEWKTLVDATKDEPKPQSDERKFDAKDIRYVKITISGLSAGAWASFFEFEVLGKELVETTVGARPTVPAGKLLAGIKVPPGFNVTLFATPPDAGYPTCLAAAPTGEVYIGIDENGSLDNKPNRGRVVRAVDKDGDGVADEFKTFAKMDSPRGVVFDHKTLYVMHPPSVTAFHDDNGDGESDRSEVLVEGLGFDLKFRGADHTTNGMRLGIDGYLYIAVGDYGFIKAKGNDGTELQLLGGGVARVRTDGSGLEIVSRGQRNIYDVAVDPLLNLFTRDNTNDGGGWNVRLSHVIPSGQYGYPSLYINFPQEIVQPLADYGGGSPCGSLFIDESILPAPFGHALYTCDWGRSIVYRHPLTAKGAGFEAKEEKFVELPRPTDMDIDASGNIYISSWRDGGFNYSGPNVGYVVRVAQDGLKAEAFPDVTKLKEAELLAMVGSGSHVRRLHAQRELLRRGDKPAVAEELAKLAHSSTSLPARVAAIFTLQQLQGANANETLVSLAKRDDLREFALRAMTANKQQAKQAAEATIVAALGDAQPRVRVAAALALGRINASRAAVEKLLPLVADTDPLISHVAIQSLIALQAGPEAVAAIANGSSLLLRGAQRVAQALHDEAVVDRLIKLTRTRLDTDRRRAVLGALCRLYLQESPYTGDWWGTRPDTTGPYYRGKTWKGSAAIAETLQQVLAAADAEEAKWLLTEMKRNKTDIGDQQARIIQLTKTDPAFTETAIDLLTSDKPSPAVVAYLAEAATTRQGATQLKALKTLYRVANDDASLAAALQSSARVVGAMSPPAGVSEAFAEFAREPRHAGRIDLLVKEAAADSALAYQLLLGVENNAKASAAARKKALAAIEAAWQKPDATVALVQAIAGAQADAYALQVAKLRESTDPKIKQAAELAAAKLDLDSLPNESDPNRVTIISQKPEDVLAAVQTAKGDIKLGSRLFVRQGCVACHSTKQGETLKGPYLGGIAARYKRPELAESVLKPSAKIAQGFEAQWFQTSDGLTLEGFVVRESGEEVEIRNQQGAASVIAKSDIDERGKREISIMPNGLIDKLTTQEFAAILAYLESLKQ